MAPRTFVPGQHAEVWIHDIVDGTDVLVLTTDEVLVEAPNWTPDGSSLLVNGDGRLWRIDVRDLGDTAPRTLEPVDTRGLPDLNNDHVLSPDGSVAYVSCEDRHIHALPLDPDDPTPPRRITNEGAEGFMHFLHGVSPDGQTLAYIGLQLGTETQPTTTDIFTIPVAGGADVRLTDGGTQHDGSEFSPDGEWLWFNSERDADAPGHAQVYRMRLETGEVERLTHDERVNWFPHPSPDGSRVVYISFPAGTLGHPENKDVILRELLPDGQGFRDLVHLHGGQGTINVNSWAPDSRRFAYVTYPIAQA